jgi:hypothetical protein
MLINEIVVAKGFWILRGGNVGQKRQRFMGRQGLFFVHWLLNLLVVHVVVTIPLLLSGLLIS